MANPDYGGGDNRPPYRDPRTWDWTNYALLALAAVAVLGILTLFFGESSDMQQAENRPAVEGAPSPPPPAPPPTTP